MHPIFVTKFTLHAPASTGRWQKIEFCLDQGTVTANHFSTPICEIELELKSGNANTLFQFALTLQSVLSFPLKLENTNKSERGYTLYTKTLQT